MPAILKQWPWSTVVICSFSLLYIFAWAVVSFYLCCRFSLAALFLPALLIPLAVYVFRCRKINKKISVLKGCISAQNGETHEGYVYLHGQLSPGITIMRDNLFILIPVNGRRTKIFFKKMTAVKETKSVTLKYLCAKRIFQVEMGEKKSVKFVVKESVAKRWSVILADGLAH